MGVWSTQFHLYGSHFQDHWAIALLIFTFIPFIGVSVIAFRLEEVFYYGDDEGERYHAFRYLKPSMVSIIIYLGLKTLNIFLSELEAPIKEGYYFTYPFMDALFGVCADYSLLLVISRMAKYVYLSLNQKSLLSRMGDLAMEGLLIPLLGLGIFQFSVSVAKWTIFLNRESWISINKVSLEHEKLFSAFYAFYLVLSIVLWGKMVMVAFIRWEYGVEKMEVRFLAITTLLMARSLTQAIVILGYNRPHHTHPKYLPTVAMALYGLFSIAIYYLVSEEQSVGSGSSAMSDILREAAQTAKKDLARRRVDASREGPTYPTVAELLTELETDPLMYFSPQSARELSSKQESELSRAMETHVRRVLRFVT